MNQFTQLRRKVDGFGFSSRADLSRHASISKVDGRGRVLIPAELRRRLDLDFDREVLVSPTDRGVEIVPADGITKEKAAFRSREDLTQFIEGLDGFLHFSVKKESELLVLEVVSKEGISEGESSEG